MTEKLDTDFEFKNKRNYVHSTTFIEKFCKTIYATHIAEHNWHKPIVNAQFHRKLSSNGYYQIINDIDTDASDEPISASLNLEDREKNISAIFVEEKHKTITKQIHTDYSIQNIRLDKEFYGESIIRCKDWVGVLENIIEVNKRIHLMTLESRNRVLSVVNLYVKRIPVYMPTKNENTIDPIKLNIENIGVQYRKGSVATLNALYFTGFEDDRFEISFVVLGI